METNKLHYGKNVMFFADETDNGLPRICTGRITGIFCDIDGKTKYIVEGQGEYAYRTAETLFSNIAEMKETLEICIVNG